MARDLDAPVAADILERELPAAKFGALPLEVRHFLVRIHLQLTYTSAEMEFYPDQGPKGRLPLTVSDDLWHFRKWEEMFAHRYGHAISFQERGSTPTEEQMDDVALFAEMFFGTTTAVLYVMELHDALKILERSTGEKWGG